MESRKDPVESSVSNRTRNVVAVVATLVLFAVVGTAAYLSRSPSADVPDFSTIQPPTHKLYRRPPPPMPPGQVPSFSSSDVIPDKTTALVPQTEIVVDVDKDGNLHIGGRPSRLESLREMLNQSHLAAVRVGVTIRADERCQIFHLKELIRACDERAGVSYKVRPLPTIVDQPPQRVRAASFPIPT